ncbi:MAG: hypothetical protein KA766_12825, partial [Piscinibacter sp.]|nr:hypothetical protein [Piscinibacter sp.]
MKRRPVLFASAAVVGLWSAWIVMHGQAGSGPVVAANEPRRRAAPPPEPVRSAEPPATGTPAEAASAPAPRARLAADGGEDAFASREWYRPPPPPPPPP